MNRAESTDQQSEHILAAFAGGTSRDLAATLHGLLVLETTFWLIERNDAAIFCVELQRLGAHHMAEKCVHSLALFESGLHRLPELGTAELKPDLIGLVNEMRALRGAPRFDEARTLLDIEAAMRHEMQRRGNVPKRLRRHLATVIDLVNAMQDHLKFEAALRLLVREAEALKGMVRFNASNLVWAWLLELTRIAPAHAERLELDELVRYCQALHRAPENARSHQAAAAALLEIAAELARLDSAHPLAPLLAADPETLAPKAPDPPPEADGSPFEVRALTEALENLEDQVSAGVLEASPISQSLASLAQEVLSSHGQVDERLAHFSHEFMQLAEFIDLAASGVTPRAEEVDDLGNRLEAYVSAPDALSQVDEALIALQRFRAQLMSGNKSEDEAALAELASLTERITRRAPEESGSRTRIRGFLLTRGALHYAVRQTEEMRIEPWTRQCSAPPIDVLFPQGEALGEPRQALAFECDGKRLGLACDRVQGPVWIEFEHPMDADFGFRMRIEGGGVCLIAPELVLSHCQ